MLVAHGLSIAALFALAGEIRQRTGSLDFKDLGGLASCAPFLGLVFGLAAFASIGLPGFANFAAELLIFFGAFGTGEPFAGFSTLQFATVLALWGVVISAVYMLRAYRAVFMGGTSGRCKGITDLPGAARWPLVLLVALLLLAGCWPSLLTDLIQPALASSPALVAGVR
jgi:NADH-quinone oxidoreductase subunit M